MDGQVKIPGIPHAFFRWYCRQERYEELHGDLEELYYERINELGLKKARLHYFMDVIRCCRPYAWRKIRSQNSTIIMFKNYHKTSFRSLMKNPLSSMINLVGLSIAIGVCILVYGFSEWVNRVDQFHENKNKVYLTTIFVDRDGELQQNGLTPRPLGAMIREDLVHVEKACRIDDKSVVIKRDDDVFYENVRFADPEFLEMFTFPLKWGTARSLEDINSIILSKKMSVKYFGDENPVGRNMLMVFSENRNKVFKVTGVAEEFPTSHAVDFDFLANFKNTEMYDPEYDVHDWSEFLTATLIQVDDPNDVQRMLPDMEKYKRLQNEGQDDWAIDSLAFEPLATLYQNSGDIRNTISSPYYRSNSQARTILLVLALFMLALACFNYINIAIVSATKRLKEIGLRKVIGANRKMVITQFLAENVIVTLLALIGGVILGNWVVIPWFEYMNNFDMGFDLTNGTLYVFLLSVLLITAVLSGIYPAFYISKFQAVTIFKGSVQFGKKNLLTRIFLGFQLILACIMIVSAVMFTQNNGYIAKRSWGYDQFGALYVSVQDYTAYEQLEAALAHEPDILSITGSGHHLGRSHSTAILHTPDREFEVDQLLVDANYFETMGLELAAGRAFREYVENDKQVLVVNQVFVENMALSDPLGQLFGIDSVKYEVVGVVNDFHSYSFASEVRPTIFRVAEKEDYRYLSLRAQKGKEYDTYEKLKAQWTILFPEIPFDGGYQEDVWGNYFDQVSMHGKFWRVVASIAVLLAGLGLFGLVSLNVAGRVREFSIRKVLGAKLSSIAGNIIRHYMALFIIALLIGAPVSYLLVKMLFESVYTYHVPMNIVGVIVSIVILISVLLGIIGIQLRTVAKSNPVEGLKAE